MKNKPVIVGDPSTVLRLGPAEMKNHEQWGQFDSDIFAHFLQIHKQLVESQWSESDCRFGTQGGEVTDSSFPALEDFVFAAVYFRQFTAHKDKLLDEVVDRYCRFCSCQKRNSWVKKEQEEFQNVLSGDAFFLDGHSVQDVFDAFLYGAALVHKSPHLRSADRARFLELYDNTSPREKLFYSLHMSLKSLLRHIENVAIVLHRDFAYWLNEYDLPRPDVRWHDRLLDTDRD